MPKSGRLGELGGIEARIKIGYFINIHKEFHLSQLPNIINIKNGCFLFTYLYVP